ncbi:MAG TPA: SAM-dependent methyltransferase [Aggregatilineales bacterium]|nr:SAM-dependent methyltransferase [Aggregatilineales bacterium]
MFKSLKGVTYRVPDLEKAKRWYAEILDTAPVFDSSLSVYFIIGENYLALVPAPKMANGRQPPDTGEIPCWWVDDIEAAYQHLLACGATLHTEIKLNHVLNASTAAVIGPDGNIVGIAGKPPAPKNVSLDEQPSASAMNVAICRALAAHEQREDIRGHDFLAEIFLGEDAQKSLEDPVAHALILKRLAAFSPGGYEFFIARTAYLDGVVEAALRDNIPQIVFLGAGYDTRAYRFSNLIKDTRIFELDSKVTQQHKRSLLDRAHVLVPEQVSFLPIDFRREAIAVVLSKAGYAPEKQTLFIWEGVTYYLPPETVDATLGFIRRNSPAGSVVCFDYMIAASDMGERHGARQAREAMKATYVGEPLQFDLEQAKIADFLDARGFAVVEHLTAKDMQTRYLTLREGSPAGEILDLFGLVKAAVRS